MKKDAEQIFNPDIPPDIEHAPLIREEALDWLETRYPGSSSFLTGQVLRMGGEPQRRWLIARLRKRNIGNSEEFSLPDTADALTTLFLRSKGVKFREAVEAVTGKRASSQDSAPRFGGVWNRLIIAALDGIRRRVPARLLASAVFSLLYNSEDQHNCLVVVKRSVGPTQASLATRGKLVTPVSHDYVYHMVLERPAPSCSVLAPSRELMFFSGDQLPARSEITSRHFNSIRLDTETASYEVVLGTMKPVTLTPDGLSLKFAGKILDIVYPHFEAFLKLQLSFRLEIPIEPEKNSADDLQLWLITQFLTVIYPGSFCEISETPQCSQVNKILASSVAKPWEALPWEPAKRLEMLSGYAGQTGVPLVVKKVEYPWTMVTEDIETELNYLKTKLSKDRAAGDFSAVALPVISSGGNSLGSLYMLMPRLREANLEAEVRILNVFSRVIGETIERHRAAAYSAETASNVVLQTVLNRELFKTALLELLTRKASELQQSETLEGDVRLPFLLVSAHGEKTDQFSQPALNQLKNWLVETLHHLEWRSFISRKSFGGQQDWGHEGFMGDIPDVGIMIALGNLVSKNELDKIRNTFPTTFNRASPSNSPVKLVSWVLDVPATRITDAAEKKKLANLADEIENWAFEVATLVDDLSQSAVARDSGEWNAALKRARQAMRKPGAHSNSYLRRLAADCSLALADWPGAFEYARKAVALSSQELGSGLVRSQCLEADACICLCQPVRALDLYTDAVAKSPRHPLPRYYRGQSLLLIARLLNVFQEEQEGQNLKENDKGKTIQAIIDSLAKSAIEDLTQAADLLDNWGLIPETYQYGNFYLVPTLLGQALAYQLTHSPGPAASRLQSARHLLPKDDLFFREFLFTKCWEQGVHRQYAQLFLKDGWEAVRGRVEMGDA